MYMLKSERKLPPFLCMIENLMRQINFVWVADIADKPSLAGLECAVMINVSSSIRSFSTCL